jgi:hypothetical protein
MASAWQSLEEAALTLGISSRTLHRRLARNEFETRLENGRREVLVVIPESPMPAGMPLTDMPADTVSDVSVEAFPEASAEYETATDTSDMSATSDISAEATPELSDEIQTTMLALHEDRIRRTDLAIMAYQQSVNVTAADARRAHRNSRVAIGVAGGMVTAMFFVALWATHSVTRAKGDVEHLNQVVRQLSDTADTRAREIEKLRSENQDARVAAARVEGELSAVTDRATAAKTQAAEGAAPASASTQPVSASTQPVSVIQRIFDRVTMR